jgi:hypothetical protein
VHLASILPSIRLRRFAAALAAILAGYGLLLLPPANGFCSLTLAPLLLVLGYGALVPWALLAKGDKTLPRLPVVWTGERRRSASSEDT